MTGVAADLTALYQQTVLAHSRSPRNFRAIPDADRQAEGHNPLCGDRVCVFLAGGDGVIEDAAFTGEGCAICMASASMMTEMVKGGTDAEAASLAERFRHMLAGAGQPDQTLGDLAALSGVRGYPVRLKCATLPWRALQHAIDRRRQTASTE